MRTDLSIDSENLFQRRLKEKDATRDNLFGKGNANSPAAKQHAQQCTEHRKRIKVGKPGFCPRF
jgi:hypothetical protein